MSSIAHPVLTLSTSSIFRTHLNIFTRVIFKIYLYVEILTSMSVTASPTSFNPLLEQLCLEFSLSQIVSNPTRISAGHSSTLDLVLLSNSQSLLSYTITEPIATSDHLSVSVQLSSSNRPPKVKSTRRKVWIYKAVNTELASDLFSSFDASLLKQNCVNESWSVWKSKFWSVIHATIPTNQCPLVEIFPGCPGRSSGQFVNAIICFENRKGHVTLTISSDITQLGIRLCT